MKVLLQHLFNDAADGKGRRSQVLWSRVLSVTACPRGHGTGSGRFSMLFNAFSMLSAAHATRLSFTMPQRRGAILRCDPAPTPVWARLACTWVQGNSQVRSSPGTACHGHAWARVCHQGARGGVPTATGGPPPCARSPTRARTLPEPWSSTAGHALRRKTHSRMLRTRLHEIICDSTP